jgi:hypothetical protein
MAGRVKVRRDEEFELRRFRVALTALMAWPWMFAIGVALVTWTRPTAWWLVPAFVDALLLIASLRKPWGLAPILVVLRFAFGTASFLFRSGSAWWWALVNAAELAIMIVVLIPIWRRFRGHDLRVRRERVERAYEEGDRRSSSRRTERELRRAGLEPND